MALTDDAIAKIKDMIVAGTLTAGDRLPPEKELGEQLGISRNSLREAVKALAFMGVLDVRHGGGTYVTSLQPNILLTSLAFVTDMQDERSMREMFEIRRVLEVHAAREAARSATPEQLLALRAELKTPDEISTPDKYLEHGVAFHKILCDMAGNEYLTALVASLNARPLMERTSSGGVGKETAERSSRAHHEIVEAIANGEVDRAGELLDSHISGQELWVKSTELP